MAGQIMNISRWEVEVLIQYLSSFSHICCPVLSYESSDFADVMLHYLLSVIEGPEALPTKLIIICSPQSSMNPTQLCWVPYKYINNKKLASIEETLVQNYNPPTIIACLKTNTIRSRSHPWMPYSYVDHIFFHLLPIIPRLPYYWQEYTVNHTSYMRCAVDRENVPTFGNFCCLAEVCVQPLFLHANQLNSTFCGGKTPELIQNLQGFVSLVSMRRFSWEKIT